MSPSPDYPGIIKTSTMFPGVYVLFNDVFKRARGSAHKKE